MGVLDLSDLMVAAKVLRGFTKLLSLSPKVFPPCNFVPFRGARNLPLAKILLVHCREDGDFTIEALEKRK